MKKIQCPVCDSAVQIEADEMEDLDRDMERDMENASLFIDCYDCGASLEVTYRVSSRGRRQYIIVVKGASPANFECPECDYSDQTKEISESSGTQRANCSNCQALLKVSWSSWGQEVQVKVLEKSAGDR